MKHLPRYKTTIEYDGTLFVGWQKQENGLSIQEVLETQLSKLLKHDVHLFGSGRTDAGVHALYQVAHFDSDVQFESDKITKSLNYFMRPNAISVISIEEVATDFHARFSAKKRSYVYRILNRMQPSVLEKNKTWHVPHSLDLDAMRSAAEHLIGKHDFSSFRASSCQAKSPVRTIDNISITKQRDIIEISIAAPSFLHNQIRIITGLLVQIGRGIISQERVPQILDAKSRIACPFTAPASGLFFIGPEY